MRPGELSGRAPDPVLDATLDATLDAALAVERRARRSLEAAIEAGGDGFALFQADYEPDHQADHGGPRLRLAYANRVAQAAFDLRSGDRLSPCLAPRPSVRIWGLVWDVLRHPDAGPRRAWVQVDLPESGPGAWDVTVAAAGPDQAVVTWRDATRGEAARRQLAETVRSTEHAVTHDAVTELPNGALLRGSLVQALSSCRVGRRVAVVFCSLNGLSDTASRHHGAPVSAGLLRGTAERLRGQLRRGDVAARLGADTFAMVLGWPATPVDPRRVLDRIADRLSRPLAVDATLLAPTVSLGLVIADPHLGSRDGHGDRDRDREADALIQRAFEAMQRSKVAGEPVVAQETDSEAEQARVAAVASYDVHDGALDEVFRATAQLAATACATRHALVTFIDADLQWVRAVVGDRLQVARGTPGPRHLALCDVAVRRRSLVVMPDLRDDPRCASRHVAWQDGVAFYAGAPLVDREGRAIGTLCVLDDVPRDVTDRQRQALTNLADLLMDVLTARRTR